MFHGFLQENVIQYCARQNFADDVLIVAAQPDMRFHLQDCKVQNYMGLPANSMRASSRTPVMVAKEDGGAVDLNIGAIPINREALVPALEGKDDECTNSPTPELLDLLRIRVAGKGWIEFNPHGQAEFIWVCYNASPCHASRPLATARFCKVGLPPRCPEAQKVQDRWPEVRDPSWRHSYRDDSQVCPHDACRHCVSLIF